MLPTRNPASYRAAQAEPTSRNQSQKKKERREAE
jgi:hypothetical protein